MQVEFGVDSARKKRGDADCMARWLVKNAVNAHMLLVGMSGSGKTYMLRRIISQMMDTSATVVPRFHVFDVHGDIELDASKTSELLFSEQAEYGLNPLVLNPDPHYGGIRKRIQSVISIINKTSRQLGGKQEACLRNVLTDLYTLKGFDAARPETWVADAAPQMQIEDGRVLLDVPFDQKDEAKACGARWDGARKCWFVDAGTYTGAITRWPPKSASRTYPSLDDAMALATRLHKMMFTGTGEKASEALETLCRHAKSYQRKVIAAQRRGEAMEEAGDEDMEKSASKALDAYKDFIGAIRTGKELDRAIRYDSDDVLKSVVDRFSNLIGSGIFRSVPPPFLTDRPIWRYKLMPLSQDERKLYTLFRLEELFAAAVQRGPCDDLRDVIVLDEAHIYMDDDPDNPVNVIAKEARKFGVALICASQSPAHFADDFVSSVATKIILGIDEMYWQGATRKLNLSLDALEWVRPRKSLLLQIKTSGLTKNDWRWVYSN